MVGTAPSSSNVVAEWRMEDLTDSVGSNDLTVDLNSPTNVSGGIIDNCYDYDGVNDNLTIPDAACTNTLLDSNWSVSLWVKPALINTQQTIFTFSKDNDVALFLNSDNQFRFNIYKGISYQVRSAVGSVSVGNWYHVVLIRSKTSGMDMYVNGSYIDDNDPYTGNGSDANRRNLIGSAWINPTYQQFFEGLIDEFQIYDVALTADNVAYLYNSPDGPGSAQQYPFSAAPGTPEFDALFAGCNF